MAFESSLANLTSAVFLPADQRSCVLALKLRRAARRRLPTSRSSHKAPARLPNPEVPNPEPQNP